MKTLTKSIALLALLGTLTLGMSDDIDSQLDAISNATGTERVALVNELKVELQNMNEEDRIMVMSRVRAEIGSENTTGEGELIRTRTRERTQSANADSVQEMKNHEYSSQTRMRNKSATMDNQGFGRKQ